MAENYGVEWHRLAVELKDGFIADAFMELGKHSCPFSDRWSCEARGSSFRNSWIFVRLKSF